MEDPGYGKIAHIYRAAGAEVTALPLDEAGVSGEALRRSAADVVHISPSHHYPTGLVMPIARRQELLRWAQEVPARVILEDDYDSEFRFVGRPIPTLFSIDGGEGIGRVTKPGLDQPVGEAAINHVPRAMIKEALEKERLLRE